MKFKTCLICFICVLLLCSPVYAGNGHGNGHAYGQQFTESVGGTNIKMSEGIDGDRYEVHKNRKQIKIELKEDKSIINKLLKKGSEYHKQTVEIPYSELEALEDFSGLVKIDHFNDFGINDYSRIENLKNVNGKAYLNLEFSSVTIAPYISQVYNWDFEEWEPGNTVPEAWVENAAGAQRSEESKINNYSVEFIDDGNISTLESSIIIAGYSTAGDYTGLINLTLPTGTDSDFSNMRFKNLSGEYLPYWIENKSDGNYANIWIRFNKNESMVQIENVATPATSESDAPSVFYSDSYHVSTDTDDRTPFDVVNGGLESLTGWTTGGASLSSDKKQGTYSYELYAVASPTGEYFEQYIDVPDWDDPVYIHFWAKGWNPKTYGYHNYFYVNDVAVQSIPDTSSWNEYYVDISSHKGTNVPIKFRVYTSNSNSDNGAAGRYDDVYITNSSSGPVLEKIVLSPTPTLTYAARLVQSPGNYTIGAWVKTDGLTSGALSVKLTGEDGFNVDSSSSSWTWYEAREYIPTANKTVVMSVNGLNSGGSFYVDGLILSEDYNTTAIEEDENRIIYQNITYTPAEPYQNSVYVTEYTDFDIYGHGKYNTSVYIDSVSSDFWLADDMIYIDTSRLSVESHNISIKTEYNLPPVLYYPVDGSTFNKTFPPLNSEITFKFEDSGTKNQVQVATDNLFQNIVYSGESTTNSTSVSLPAGVYYWRVRTYDPTYSVYSEYSDISTFTLNSQPVFEGTGINGVVYDVETGAPLSNAIVQIYNDTWSGEPYTTAGDGYYYFPDLVDSTTYAIYATKTAYENSNIYYVTTSPGEYVIKNVPMQSEEGAGIYYEKHYVRFIVTDKQFSQTYPANVKVFVGDSTASLYEQDAGTDGAVAFWLDQKTRYRFETTYNGQTQTDYITPIKEEYYIFLEWLGTESTFLPENQFNDDVNITVTHDTDTGQVVIYYADSLAQTETLKFQIGRTENNGTYTIIDESAEYISTSDKIETFTLTDYTGNDYRIKVILTHGIFGSVTRDYGVSFPGNNLPFGKPVSYLCVFVLLIVGMQFSAKDANTGAILICGLASFMWFLDLFKPFGDGVNALMGVGIGAAVFYAILAYINEKRREEAL